MATNLKKSWQLMRSAYLRQIEDLSKLESVLLPIREIEGIERAAMYLWRTPATICLDIDAKVDGEAIVKTILKALHLTTAKRTFDESSGKTVWSILGLLYDGQETVIEMSSTPIRCKIEIVEEDVFIPEQPARTEKKKRYRIANPEECFSKEQEASSGGTP